MSKNNDVGKVLFLPEAAAHAAATRVGDLTNGEWAVFNYDTGLSIDATAITAATLPNNFFIAYRGDGTLGTAGELYFTSGTHMQKQRVRNYTSNAPADPVAQAVKIDTFTGVQSGPDATNYDYGVKFDFRGNSEIYTRFGYNQASKFFMGNTRCVGNSGAAADAGAEVVAQWAEAAANDPDQFISMSVAGTGVTNTPVVYTASGVPGTKGAWSDSGGAITEAVALAEIRAYTTGSGDLAITFTFGAGSGGELGFSSLYTYCGVNPKYFKQRQIKAITSLVSGLVGSVCNWGTITQTVAMVYGEGWGYDINELEYQCGGFTGKPGPRRQSNLNGLPFSDYEFIAAKLTKYTVRVLSYDQFSTGGWLDYENAQSTYFILVASPAATAGYPAPILDLIGTACGLTKITS